MSYLFNFLIVFLVMIFQTSLAYSLAILGVVPNLVLVVVILWVIFRGREGVLIAFLLGVFLDIISGQLGVSTISLLVVSIFILFISEDVLGVLNLASRGALIVGATIIYDLIYLLYLKFWGFDFLFLGYLYRLVLPETIYNLVLGILVYFLFSKYFDWLLQYERQINLPQRIKK